MSRSNRILGRISLTENTSVIGDWDTEDTIRAVNDVLAHDWNIGENVVEEILSGLRLHEVDGQLLLDFKSRRDVQEALDLKAGHSQKLWAAFEEIKAKYQNFTRYETSKDIPPKIYIVNSWVIGFGGAGIMSMVGVFGLEFENGREVLDGNGEYNVPTSTQLILFFALPYVVAAFFFFKMSKICSIWLARCPIRNNSDDVEVREAVMKQLENLSLVGALLLSMSFAPIFDNPPDYKGTIAGAWYIGFQSASFTMDFVAMTLSVVTHVFISYMNNFAVINFMRDHPISSSAPLTLLIVSAVAKFAAATVNMFMTYGNVVGVGISIIFAYGMTLIYIYAGVRPCNWFNCELSSKVFEHRGQIMLHPNLDARGFSKGYLNDPNRLDEKQAVCKKCVRGTDHNYLLQHSNN